MRGAPATFADRILHHARLCPEQPAIILVDRLVTFDMLAQGILCAEARIGDLDLAQDEVVCVTVASPIRQLILSAALFRLGQPSMAADTAEEIIALNLPVRTYLQDPGDALTPGFRRLLVDEDWFAGPRRSVAPARPFASEDALCRVDVSSGSTGRPKAAWMSVGGFRRLVRGLEAGDAVGVRGRVLNLLRLSGTWGFRVSAHLLTNGDTLVCANSARQALQMAAAYRVDAIVGSTQQVRDLVREQTRAAVPLPSVKALLVGGARTSPDLLKEARAHLCTQVSIQYGATEVGSMSVTPADVLPEVEGATGYAQPGVVIEIVDDQDRPLPAGAAGIVRVRAPAMTRGFPRDDSHTNLRGGWFYPDDRGRLTEEGMLILEGRVSEVINSGGAKHAPEGIEELVLRHPNVADVAAFGVRGEGGVEEINLAVVTRAPIAEGHLIDWCAERGLEVARVFVVDALPRTAMGKTRRDELKASLGLIA